MTTVSNKQGNGYCLVVTEPTRMGIEGRTLLCKVYTRLSDAMRAVSTINASVSDVVIRLLKQ